MEITDINNPALLKSKVYAHWLNPSFAIAIIILMALLPIVPPSWKVAVGIIIVIITALSWRRSAFYLGLFGSICFAIMITRIPYSQLLFALAIGLYLLIISLIPSLKGGLAWFRWGTFGGMSCLYVWEQ